MIHSKRSTTILFVALLLLSASAAVGQNWLEIAEFYPSNAPGSPTGGQGDRYGTDVSIDGNYAVVGAGESDSGAPNGGTCYVYERTASGWAFMQEIISSDINDGDQFGYSVDISGTRIVVGAPESNSDVTSSGAVYLFELVGGVWIEQQRFIHADRESFDGFGHDVAIDDDYLLVSSFSDNDLGLAAGAAYLFEYDGSAWSDTTKLLASDGVAQDRFAYRVALDDTLAICGAFAQDPGAIVNAGAAYVYSRNGGAWPQVQKLVAVDAGPADNFGIDLAARGGKLVVGARRDDQAVFDGGAAYIYTHTASGYSFSQKVTTSDAGNGDFVGTVVDIDSDRMVLGVQLHDHAGLNSGAAYIFDFDGTSWSQTLELRPADISLGDAFGGGISIDGDDLVVTAQFDDDAGIDSGSGYFFSYDGTSWVQDFKASDNDMIDDPSENTFGNAVAMSNDYAVVASSKDDDFGTSSGSVTFYKFDGNDWVSEGEVHASDASQGLNFGFKVAMHGNIAVISGHGDDTNGSFSGSAYVFERIAGAWVEVQKLVPGDGDSFDSFGFSVSTDGETIVVGSYLDDDNGNGSGAAYVYSRQSGVWTLDAKLRASDLRDRQRFGIAVGVANDIILIGARDDGQQVVSGGAAYVFSKTTGSWVQEAKLFPNDPSANKLFGASVSISDSTLLVGALGDGQGGANSGAVYAFGHNGTWGQTRKIKAGSPVASQFFGFAIDHIGNRAVVGAYRDRDASNVATGAAYILEQQPSGLWTQIQKLEHQPGSSQDYFGISTAISGDAVLVGAQFHDQSGFNAGAAYFFQECADDDSDGACDFLSITSQYNVCEEAKLISALIFGRPSWDTLSYAGATQSLPGTLGDANDDIWCRFTASSSRSLILAQDIDAGNDVVVEVYSACGGELLMAANFYSAGAMERVLVENLIVGEEYFYRLYNPDSTADVNAKVRTAVKSFSTGGLQAQYCSTFDYTFDDVIIPQRQDFNELYPFTDIVVKGYALQLIDDTSGDTLYLAQAGVQPQFFHIDEIPGIAYNTSYSVRARHFLRFAANGAIGNYWSDYGASCSIGLLGPVGTRVRDPFCDAADAFQLSDYIQAEIVTQATAYRFRFTQGSTTFTKFSASYTCFLSQVPQLMLGLTYDVDVQARVNGLWSDYGQVCQISTEGDVSSIGLQSVYCDQTYDFPSSTYILSDYLQTADKYQWKFTPTAGGPALTKVTNGLSFAFHTSGLQFQSGIYRVAVRARVAGIWGQFAQECFITIASLSSNAVEDDLSSFNKQVSFERNSELSITTHPSPSAGDHFELSLLGVSKLEAQEARVEIFDMAGRMLFCELLSPSAKESNYRITPQRELPKGVYIIVFDDGLNRFSVRHTVN